MYDKRLTSHLFSWFPAILNAFGRGGGAGGCLLPPSSYPHHVAGDEAYPHDAHDERDDVVLLVLRSGAVGHGKTKPHHEGKPEDEQKTLSPALRPLEPVVLTLRSQNHHIAQKQINTKQEEIKRARRICYVIDPNPIVVSLIRLCTVRARLVDK